MTALKKCPDKPIYRDRKQTSSYLKVGRMELENDNQAKIEKGEINNL